MREVEESQSLPGDGWWRQQAVKGLVGAVVICEL
jgi:hypothetical protein